MIQLEIVASESFGVRSLCCFVETDQFKVIIDPGLSLAPRRFNLPPHPLEIKAAERLSKKIELKAKASDFIIITHFHHDHFTPFYEHKYNYISREIYKDKIIFMKSPFNFINKNQEWRGKLFLKEVEKIASQIEIGDGKSVDNFLFSPPVPHGDPSRKIFLIMVMVMYKDRKIILGSDIQALDKSSVRWILQQEPDTLILSGPPIYLPELRKLIEVEAISNLSELIKYIKLIIIEHHFLRGLEYDSFLFRLKEIAYRYHHTIVTGFEYMNSSPLLLEAQRKELFQRKI